MLQQPNRLSKPSLFSAVIVGMILSIYLAANGAFAERSGGQPYKRPGAGGNRVELFVTSWCPYCRQLESFLIKNNVDYTRYDIEEDFWAKAEHQRMGGGGVPVTRVGKTVLRGFSVPELSEVLRRYGLIKGASQELT